MVCKAAVRCPAEYEKPPKCDRCGSEEIKNDTCLICGKPVEKSAKLTLKDFCQATRCPLSAQPKMETCSGYRAWQYDRFLT